MAIKCGRGPHYHETLLDVRACYNGENVETIGVVSQDFMNNGVAVAPNEPDATEKQISFVCSLAEQKLEPTEASIVKRQASEGHWGRRSISEEIARLKALPRLPVDSAYHDARESLVKATESHRTAQTPVTLEAGMYRMGETIYKVQLAVHGSGNPYAKRLTQTDECRECGRSLWGDKTDLEHKEDFGHDFQAKWKFEYAPGAIRELRPEHRMALEEAKEFGAIYGICCVCAATLTNETSIEAGIGPVCGGRV